MSEELNASEEKHKKTKWRTLFHKVFIILVFVFLIRYFVENWETYRNLNVKINGSTIIVAVGFHFVYKVMLASLWHYITVLNQCSIRYSRAIITYLYSVMGKYIPGKVFMLLARVTEYEKEGRPVAGVVVSYFLENICTLLGAAFLFVVSLLFFPNDLLSGYKWAAVLLILLFFILIHPKILNSFLLVIKRIIRKDFFTIPFSYRDMLKTVILFIINWIVLGIGFYFICCAVYSIPKSQLLYVSGVFGLSVVGGLLAVFAPSGIGVREGIMVLGLTMIMPEEYAVLISIVSRIWMTFSELTIVFLAFIFDRCRQIKNKIV